jgi:uncharacterized protein (DUF608 family)
MENKTIKDIAQYMISFLKENKIKKINEGEDLILFDYKEITYSIFIEDEDIVHYGVHHMHDVDLGRDFWEFKDEVENYEHVEDWFESIVKANVYAKVKKIWKTFEKLEEEDENEDLHQMASIYFGMF